MRTKLTKKLLSALLTVAMLAAMVPAAFAANSYTLTYMNDGSQIASETVSSTSPTLSQTATKSGYTFMGWTQDSARTLWGGPTATAAGTAADNGSDATFVKAGGSATITGDTTFYAVFQTRIDETVRAAGWSPERFRSLVFPGAQHNEASWNQRLDVPLIFLLPPA